jgi:hypothetical protein
MELKENIKYARQLPTWHLLCFIYWKYQFAEDDVGLEL